MSYVLEVKMDFAAAHIVRGHPGKCARLHGHNWEVRVRVKSSELNSIEITMDFADLKALIHEVIDPLDHQFLNEIPPFTEMNPTAERVSEFIYDSLAKKLPAHVRMDSVSLFETERCSVTFSRG